MNKKLVMWGTFLVVFLASAAGSYKFINKDNQDMTIELAAPVLPLVSMVIDSGEYNILHGFTGDMDVTDVAEYICPMGEDRKLQGRVETLGTSVQAVKYEVRNNDGSRLKTPDLVLLKYLNCCRKYRRISSENRKKRYLNMLRKQIKNTTAE